MHVQKVSELVSEIKKSLESQYREVRVEGEISNLSFSSAGHWYFTISDSEASLSVALFKMDAFRNPLVKNLKNGDKVICVGGVGVYPKRGTFQLIARSVQLSGKGDLKEQYEQLKKKLAQEGLFDQEIKKRIPQFPQRVGVITARGGAALQDFINVFARRSFAMDILVIPALVQGEGAPVSIRRALADGLKRSDLDLIVLTRGGGSMEDLWAFNDEKLVRDIFEAKIPIVSAIGHQTDFTLCDFVADLRCETPTAAAEMLTAPQMQIRNRIDNLKNRLFHHIETLLGRLDRKLRECHPRMMLEKIWNRLYKYQNKLASLNIVDRYYELTGIAQFHQQLDLLISGAQISLQNNLQKVSYKLHNLHDKLHTLNPTSVLNRGYSYLQTRNGDVVSDVISFQKIPAGESLDINFRDGKGKVQKV